MPSSFRHLAVLLFALLGAMTAATVRGDGAAAPRPAEYMIYQYPDVALVVIVDAREAEFTARIAGPEDALITEAGVAGRRVGPVWMYVDSTDRPRQLMVRVQPSRAVTRGDIGMELMQFSMSDPNARRQAQAYSLLAHGLQQAWAEDSATWVQRGQSLRNAARAFAALGMEQMRLWAEHYAAHLVLHRLDDVLTALELCSDIDRAARRAGFEDVAFANRILAAEALLRGADKSPDGQAGSYLERAHVALDELAARAAARGFAGEQARALWRDGEAWERQGETDRAVERYTEALEAAARAADTDLLNGIRATAAAAYERQGSTSGAIGLLEDIAGDQPAAVTAAAERARTLYEKGRLLGRAYRHAEAAEALAEALALQQDDPDISQWGRTGLALGRALYMQGDLQEANRILLEALPRAGDAGPVELAGAYAALADIARAEGRFDAMTAWRERAAGVPGSARAGQVLAAARDAAARDGDGSAAALQGFRQAREQAVAEGERRLRDAADLQLCLHRLLAGRGCDVDTVEGAHAALVASGVPAAEADARLTWVRILRARGDARGAVRELERLFARLRLYRERLPGVLGAWDWARRSDAYREAAALALERGRDGAALLLALEQVRSVELGLPAGPLHEDLRNRIALLESGAATPGTALQVSQAMAALEAEFARSATVPDRDFLDAMLGRLGRRETLLAWYLGEREAYLLAADRGGVRLHRLGSSSALRDRIEALGGAPGGAFANPAAETLDRLGAALLGPVADDLGERVYVLTQGALNGVPIDALRLGGRFLAERSEVARLASLAALERRRPRAADDLGGAVFLAGNPQSGQDPFSYDVARSQEIDAVRDRFVGAGLHIVQGVALDRNEFDGERLAAAGLLHLALPGRIDLADPERSRLRVAGAATADAFLSAADLRKLELAAGLAVLSATTTEGRPRSAFDGRIGLVADLHAAGAAVVVASLWPAGDAANAAVMAEFYDRLAADADVVAAFSAARRARIDRADPTNLRPWAGFQLFIR
jgi:tetratricopeptide (TPR) repeat protein